MNFSQNFSRNAVQLICQENDFVFSKTKRTAHNERIEYDTPVEFEDIFNMVQRFGAVMLKPESRTITIFFSSSQILYDFSETLGHLILSTKTQDKIYKHSIQSNYYQSEITLTDFNGNDMIIQLCLPDNNLCEEMHAMHAKFILDKVIGD